MLYKKLGKAISQRESNSYSMISDLAHCESKIIDALDKLGGEIRNEAELRNAIGDPIAWLICRYWNYKVRFF